MPVARAQDAILRRPIPHGGGEALAVVGLGTAVVFSGANSKDRTGPTEVVRALVAGGATLIDTAPSYGDAEGVVGETLAATNLRPKVFIATKLERFQPGAEAEEARASLQRLKTDKIDLLQLHNVRDPNQDMGGVNALKAQGICRYTGITTTSERDYDAAEAIVRRAKPDFLEIDYAIDNRKAEERLLPAARDAGTAVLTALPFGRGRLFRAALGKPLPEWTKEFDCASWAQFFLKFVISHPTVIAAIPGTNKAEHMVDNLGAGRGRLPDAQQRKRMIDHLDTLR
jgi:aryl-alcohol dehydrogenase-like predicted oxidoreductase